MDSTTWHRDNAGLFDYQAQPENRASFVVDCTCQIYRHSACISYIIQLEEWASFTTNNPRLLRTSISLLPCTTQPKEPSRSSQQMSVECDHIHSSPRRNPISSVTRTSRSIALGEAKTVKDTRFVCLSLPRFWQFCQVRQGGVQRNRGL